MARSGAQHGRGADRRTGRLFLALVASLGILLLAGAGDAARAATSPSATAPSGRLAVGPFHSCEVKTDGTPLCWGDDVYGQRSIPPGLGQVTQIATGGQHTCALTAARTVRCWGQDQDGQTDVPDTLRPVVAVAAGANHSCAIQAGGTPVCWGASPDSNSDHPTNLFDIPPFVGTVTQISISDDHQCVVRTDRTPVCWGTNTFGEAAVPPGIGTVTQISTSQLHTCVVRTDGTPVCWGRVGTGIDVPAGLGPVTQISTGETHTCAVKADGTAACWGDDRLSQSTIPAGLGTVTQIAAGDYGTCAVTTSGPVLCWGYDRSTHPAATVPLLAGGADHTCAIRVDGTPTCWGDDSHGQSTVPAGVGTVTQISAGARHTCAVRTDGTPTCWGDDTSGQSTVPAGVGTVTWLSAGGSHTCAVRTGGTPACWGDDTSGQSTVPAGLGAVVQVAAGGAHTCALPLTGPPTCWGDDTHGQLTPIGPATETVSTQIVAGDQFTCVLRIDLQGSCWGADDQAPGLFDFATQLAAGGAHLCAISPAGAGHCSGASGWGQTTIPADLFTLHQITAGGRHTCAVTTGGRVACWGANDRGQLGGAPTFTSDDPSATLNASPYTHTFTAGPAAGPRARFAVTFGSLPPGLTLDGATGVLSGTPTTDGRYSATITASNGVFGPDATQTVTFDVHATPPFAPLGLATATASPSASLTPVITGAATPGTTVRLYAGGGCTGTPLASGSADTFATTGLAVTVPADRTTTIRATATDAYGNASPCSAPLTYVNDRTAPPAPSSLASTPGSPSPSLVTVITGAAEAGATVLLYAGSSCTGAPVAAGTAAAFSSPGLPVSVAADSTTMFSATATDRAGNTSACSAPLTYVNEQPALVPAPPALITALSASGWCLGRGTGATRDLALRYTLNQDATVVFSLQRRMTPPSDGIRRCPATPPAPTGRFSTAATRAVWPGLAGAAARRPLRIVRDESAGDHALRLLRAFRVASLQPGIYRLRITPIADDGTPGAVRTLTFVVLRPKTRR